MKTLILSLAAMAAAFSGTATAQTAPHEVKAREIYARVISFRTAAGQQQTPAMVAYLIETLKAGGVPEADIATLDDGGERALIVRIPGRKQGRPILFSAHMDVVDARREDWERDPFKLIEENGNFYGRGTARQQGRRRCARVDDPALQSGAAEARARARLRLRRR